MHNQDKITRVECLKCEDRAECLVPKAECCKTCLHEDRKIKDAPCNECGYNHTQWRVK